MEIRLVRTFTLKAEKEKAASALESTCVNRQNLNRTFTLKRIFIEENVTLKPFQTLTFFKGINLLM